MELEILRGTQWFTGQTDWDRAHVWSQNPRALYLRVGRVLRPEFYRGRWSVDTCQRHTIIFTNAGTPYRDVDTLLDAVEILQPSFPDIKLRLCGYVGGRWGYQRFIARKLRRMGPKIERLGYLAAGQLHQALLDSHVFAICSHIENESISMCEAMLLGLPCVASYAGGMPTTVSAGRGGLLFPPGDAALLADCIRRVFEDDGFASSLGQAAREEARVRHDPQRVVQEQMDAYKMILEAATVREPPSRREVDTRRNS
jgi:glycosyltransferase involved in cell wall biosynthesis